MTTNKEKRRGSVTTLVAFCLVVLLGFAALTIDGGLMVDYHQRAQAAADAAAFAAAEDLFRNWQSNQGTDPGGTAAAAAKASAAANGFPNPTVNIPPLSGLFVGQTGYVEVIVQTTQQRYFSKVFGSQAIPIAARAVARGRWQALKVGVMVLNPTAPGSLSTNGGGTMAVAGVPIIVNSTSPTAATAVGGGTLTAPEFDIAGVPGIGGSGVWNGTVLSGQPQIPDPLAYLPEPDPSTMTVQSTHPTHVAGSQTLTVYPGVYKGGITVTGQGTLNMMPGIYYMDGGGFSFTGLGALNAVGVMIVNAPKSNSDNININGNGTINFSPPTSGIYAGISLWQVRSATNTIYVSGNGTSTMSGTFYTANGTLNVSGNGANDVVGSQYISYNLTVGGNGDFAVNWNANLTARVRIIQLVE
jgi:Flp pilus assembly protein TadG